MSDWLSLREPPAAMMLPSVMRRGRGRSALSKFMRFQAGGDSMLEPAAGIGHFFGAVPEAVTARTERVAVELDSITARILRYLYAMPTTPTASWS